MSPSLPPSSFYPYVGNTSYFLGKWPDLSLPHLDGFTSPAALVATTLWVNDWDLLSTNETSLPSRILSSLQIQRNNPTCTSRWMRPHWLPLCLFHQLSPGHPKWSHQSFPAKSQRSSLPGTQPRSVLLAAHVCAAFLIIGTRSHLYSPHLSQSIQGSVGNGVISDASITSWFSCQKLDVLLDNRSSLAKFSILPHFNQVSFQHSVPKYKSSNCSKFHIFNFQRINIRRPLKEISTTIFYTANCCSTAAFSKSSLTPGLLMPLCWKPLEGILSH